MYNKIGLIQKVKNCVKKLKTKNVLQKKEQYEVRAQDCEL